MAIKVGGTTVIDNTRSLTNISNLTATGDATIANLTASGNATMGDLTATGNATIGNLTATGNTTIGNLTASGNVEFSGTGAITLPAGTTAQQPSALSAGQLRFNTENNKAEIYDGTKFGTVGGGEGGGLADYVIADSSASEYVIKQLEIVETDFTPSTLWEVNSSGTLVVLDMNSIDESGEYIEETTSLNSNYAFYDTLKLLENATVTIATNKVMQGFDSYGAAVAGQSENAGKNYYLNNT
jgi:hypothetical protein